MTTKAWTAAYIRQVSDDLTFVAEKLSDVAKKMETNRFPELYLNAESAFGVYRKTLLSLAGDVEAEFREQLRCSKTGEVPSWKINQALAAARKQAKAERISKGIEPGHPKKVAKKPRKNGQ